MQDLRTKCSTKNSFYIRHQTRAFIYWSRNLKFSFFEGGEEDLSFSRTLIKLVISPWQPQKEWFIAGEEPPLHRLLYRKENLSFLFWFYAESDQKGPSWGLFLPHHLKGPESRQWSHCNFEAFIWKLYSSAQAAKELFFNSPQIIANVNDLKV